jgi:hypothetical protein
MPWLDPRLRCNRCGTPFTDEHVAVCPGCGADLATVGTQCDLRDWGVARRRGSARFVWRRWVLGWGGLLASLQCGVYAWRGGDDPVVYALTALWPVGGYVIGRQHWRGAEREYAAWVAQPEEQRHAEPSTAADGEGR